MFWDSKTDIDYVNRRHKSAILKEGINSPLDDPGYDVTARQRYVKACHDRRRLRRLREHRQNLAGSRLTKPRSI